MGVPILRSVYKAWKEKVLLENLEAKNIAWGIVTNKPSWLTNPLMEALNLTSRAATIVSGDTAEKAKPHPEPMYHACNEAGLDPQTCLYVGDAERDIQAGRAAGMKTVAALFGYIQDDDIPDDWKADYYINHPEEILKLL